METLGPALTRWVLYSAVSILIGAALFHWLVLVRSQAPAPARKAAIRRSLGSWATLAALALMASVLGVLWFQFRDFHDPVFDPWQSSLRLLVVESLWGKIWMAQFGLALLALPAALVARAQPTGGTAWPVLTFVALASGAMPALSGHSFGAERLLPLAVGFDALHVWAAGGWIGLLAVLFLAARRHLADEPEPAGVVAEWVGRFSPVALTCFAILGVTGTFASWLHLDGPGQLVTTTYGRVLLGKLTLLGGVIALGYYNWRRVTPLLRSREGRARFLGFSAPIEMVLGFLVLLVTGFLVATSLPLEVMGS